MNNNEFYDVIDNEIQQIVDVNKDNPELQKKKIVYETVVTTEK